MRYTTDNVGVIALLRFTDPSSGKIILDGIDITSIGVDDLRRAITYIPQVSISP